ncbi:hypothetical protein QQG55_21325 [Brugia pahangi]
MIFISLYANQLDNKSLRRRCDSLNGITCECANPLVQWINNEGKIFKINEIYHGKEIILCYIMEFINHTNHYDLVSDAQGCKHLEEYYDVSMEPALFLTFQNMEVLNLHLQQHFKIYQSQEIDATTGLSFDMINGFFWSNNTNVIDESILSLINQTNTTDICLKFFLTYNKEKGPILKANKCDAMISQYIRICYYAINYIKSTTKMTDKKYLQFKTGNLLKNVNVNNISNISNTGNNIESNLTADWSNECSYLLWEYNNRKICYVPIIKYFKRTVSLHYNLINKMCSSKFPWISARIRNRKQISILRNFTESFLEVNQIHIKHIPILIGLIHMRGMGFIWTTGNNGSYLNSWDSSYDSLYDEMPFWIDPTFHPYLNTTEIHCHRFVIWTHTNDNYARAIPCEYPTNVNLVLCEYDCKIKYK